MYKFLNRICYIISFILSYCIIDIFFSNNRMHADKNDILFFVIALGVLIKIIFFSNHSIKHAIEKFYNGIKNNILKQNNNENIEINSIQDNENTNTIEQGNIEPINESIEIKNKVETLDTQSGFVAHDQYIAEQNININESQKEIQITELNNTQEIIKENEKINITQKEIRINPIVAFFSENTLAKVGGILIFLGVLFFLTLIYTSLSSIGRFYLSFIISIVIYISGCLIYKKDYKQEGLVLFGTSFLVNYLIILSGRYIIEVDGQQYLSQAITLILLIINTIFAISTSLKYKSHTLLFFSFMFGYINPFLVGKGDNSPYVLLIYNMLISGSSYYLLFNEAKSKDYKNIDNHKSLYYLFVIGSNLLTIVAPFMTGFQWAIKIISLLAINTGGILLCKKINKSDWLQGTFIAIYIGFFILLYNGINILGNGFASIKYMLVYVGFLFFMIFASIFTISMYSLGFFVFLLIMPLVAITYIIYATSLLFALPLAFIFFIGYLFIIIFSIKKLNQYKIVYYLLGIVLGFILLINIKFISNIQLDKISLLIIYSSAIIFLIFNYVLSLSKQFEKLYIGGTVGVILLLLPLLDTVGPFTNYSLITIVLFALINMIWPLFYKGIGQTDGKTIARGLLYGFGFSALWLYLFYQNAFYINIGIGFIISSIVYSGTLLILKFKENIIIRENNEGYKVFYAYFSIILFLLNIGSHFINLHNISLFIILLFIQSLILFFITYKNKITPFIIYGIFLLFLGNILFLFNVQDISITYFIIRFLVQLTLVFLSYKIDKKIISYKIFNIIFLSSLFLVNLWLYFYLNNISIYLILLFIQSTLFILLNKVWNNRLLYLYSCLFMGVGILFMFQELQTIYIIIISVFQLINLVLLYQIKEENRLEFDILHIIVIIGILIHIVHNYSYLNIGNIYLLIGIILGFIGSFYKFFGSKLLMKSFGIGYLLYLIMHLFSINYILGLESTKLSMQYILMTINIVVFFFIKEKIESDINKKISIIIFLYFFIFSSITNNHILSNTFLLTMYRGLLVFLLLYYGIVKPNKSYRSIGLYILILLLLKVFFYDVWYAIDGAISRVIAFMVLGIMLVYISMLYKKYLQDKIQDELNLINLFELDISLDKKKD